MLCAVSKWQAMYTASINRKCCDGIICSKTSKPMEHHNERGSVRKGITHSVSHSSATTVCVEASLDGTLCIRRRYERQKRPKSQHSGSNRVLVSSPPTHLGHPPVWTRTAARNTSWTELAPPPQSAPPTLSHTGMRILIWAADRKRGQRCVRSRKLTCVRPQLAGYRPCSPVI